MRSTPSSRPYTEVRITFIRNAASKTNASDLSAGSASVGLSPEGEPQSDLLAQHTPTLDADRFIISDLARARLTAEKAFNPSIRFEKNSLWQERDFGIIRGTNWVGVPVQYPTLFGTGCGAFSAEPPKGESLNDVDERVGKALAILMSSHFGHTLIVTHEGSIRLVACALLGLNPATQMWGFEVDNTSVSTFDLMDSTPILTRWNDGSHLGAARSDPRASR